MSAFLLYLALHRAGLVVSTNGAKILVTPAEKLTDELRSAIRVHKTDLIALLESAHHTAGSLVNWVVDLDAQTTVRTLITFRTASLAVDQGIQTDTDKAGREQA